MAKRKTKKQESDGAYVLKLVLYVIVGSLWLFVKTKSGDQLPIPVGVLIGSFYAMHDHFSIDRKIEYAVLLTAMLIGYFAQVGVLITL